MKRLKKESFLAFTLYIIPWTIYFGIVWFNAIKPTVQGWMSAYLPHWGDGAAHLSYMSAFAYRNTFPAEHPLFAGHPFTYSFVADMIGGLFVKAGLSLWLSYNLWGFGLSILALIGIWKLIKVITQSSWISTLSGYLFLFSGGFGWKYLILDKLNPAGKPEISYFPLLLTQREDSNLVWLNVIVGELLPQRAFLLALPLGALLLYMWFRTFFQQKNTSYWLLFLTGIILGCMPVVHPHTTMILVSTIAIWLLPKLTTKTLEFIKGNRQKIPVIWLQTLAIGIPALIIGLSLTLTFLTPSVSSGFFKWYPGWIAKSKDVNWIVFWIDNWGLFLPLAIIGTLFFISKQTLLIITPFWLWFFLANLFLFQPYDWDNSKLLTWVYLLFCIPVAQTLKKIWQGHIIQKILALLLVVIITLAGAFDSLQMLDTKTYNLELVNTEEVNMATELRKISPPDSIILTATYHDNWVPILTGRQVLCGYLGWMWTYGINADQRINDMKQMFAGTKQASQLLAQYGIDYVVIGPQERNEFSINEQFFAQYKPVITTPSTTIYQIN